MNTVNKTAARTIWALIEICEANGGHVKIENSGGVYMALSVKQVGSGKGYKIYAFAHYYEQNGDLIADPDMTFIVHDDRLALPMAATFQDIFGYQVAVEQGEAGGFRIRRRLLSDLCSFANSWMKNIRDQQNIKMVKVSAA